VNYSQLLNVHSISDARQSETHTTEQLVPDPCPSEVEIATVRLKSYKSISILIKISADSFKQVVKHYGQGINLFIAFGKKKNCMISERTLLLYKFTNTTIKLLVIIIVDYYFY
jgi:hypothetical protein